MKLRVAVILIVSIILLVSCQQENREEPLAREEQNNNNRFVQVENSDPVEQQNLNNGEIASHLANIASNVPNVYDAAAVVAGPYAVVGINVDKDLDRSRVGTIKYSVLEALYHDPYGKTAVVVADADVVERIRGMGDKIGQGHPVRGVVDELAAIVGRYMPEFPINNDQPQEPDQNKEILPEEDRQKLEEIEGEQSHHQNE
ncbi:YhcN/YlaJ family sporulation lipoprotein [Virgibacillus sp. C22-A2]|uniref:YhcN/YlaJ family sporulation lipoprotein n=1 Tax=Virgibacillus tibetensis TaxID=3042313 RepID=A0ABU6KEG2_9BACI|nr:YhcN/YlaJ family sporulation lipoprotein [Virgibacillus sp. C22-A2]